MQFSNLRRRRGILLLIPILAVTAILLITSPVARDAYVQLFPPPPPLPSSYFPAPGEISRWLQEEDRRYQLVVDKRHAFAKKLGDNIESFPTDGKTHLLWDFFPPTFQCPHRTERVGALGDGGKWVCGMEVLERQERCVVYSFGISTESSFEAEILERALGCHVWGYDFSVNNFGPEISRQPQLLERATFHKWGLGARDEAPHAGKPQMYTLRSLMRMNGHDFIDVLKIDIEGAEFGALAAVLDDVGSELDGSATPTTPPLPFGQLQIEIHADYPHGDYATFTRWWEALEAAGLRPFQAEPNLPYVNVYHRRPDYAEYSFINIRGGHPLIVG